MARPKPSPAQIRQHELAWLLFQTRGAAGNLSVIVNSYKSIGPAVESRVRSILGKLEELDSFVQATLARDSHIRAASFRPATSESQKESP